MVVGRSVSVVDVALVVCTVNDAILVDDVVVDAVLVVSALVVSI